MKVAANISRRSFLFAAPALGVLALSCRKEERIKVFKFPESAEEIADFNEFFTAADMTEAEVIRRLNITGTPKIANLQYGSSFSSIWPKGSGFDSEVTVHTEYTDDNFRKIESVRFYRFKHE